MNGEVKSSRLNDPLKWDEFKSMPDDLKVVYIQALRKKYNVPNKHLTIALGWPHASVDKTMEYLGLTTGKRGHYRWDKEGFYAWANGVDVPTPVIEEEPAEAPVIEEAPVHFYTEEERESIFGIGEAKGYVEDDLPFEEADPQKVERLIDATVSLAAENKALQTRIDELLKINEELMAVREKDNQEIAWLRKEYDSLNNVLKMREAQLEIVQLIFGGKNNG